MVELGIHKGPKNPRQWHAGSIPAPGTINYMRSVMTLDKQLEILQAANEGKTIEYCIHGNWHILRDVKTYKFNFLDYDYRVKKQTKKVYLYALQNADNRISQTSFYFENEQQAKNKYPCWDVIKRLDYTELEIDE